MSVFIFVLGMIVSFCMGRVHGKFELADEVAEFLAVTSHNIPELAEPIQAIVHLMDEQKVG
jgi:ABC-type nitrate/sulfonate/bicarbonate transport system permease component